MMRWLTTAEALDKWMQIEPLILPALEYDPYQLDIEDLRHGVGVANIVVIVVEKHSKVVMACLLNTTQAKGGVHWQVVALGGEHVTQWVAELIEMVENVARATGCVGILFRGRHGWVKHVKDHGFSHMQSILKKDLTGK